MTFSRMRALKNGLAYEMKTSLKSILGAKYTHNGIKYQIFQGNNFHKNIQSELDKKCEKILLPDEAIVDFKNKRIYILEKKFQSRAGSADEKIQTGPFKRDYYMQQYPTYDIKFAYVLSDWFKQQKYLPEMRFLARNDIMVFWGSDVNYPVLIKLWIGCHLS